MLDYVADFLARAHAADERFTARDGINVARYSLKLLKSGRDEKTALTQAVRMILGEDGLAHVT